jgi:hypothetical protein
MHGLKQYGIISIFVALSALIVWGWGAVEAEPFESWENLNLRIDWLEQEIRNGRNIQLDLLAPISFAQAEEILNDAKEGMEDGEKREKKKEKIFEVQVKLYRV